MMLGSDLQDRFQREDAMIRTSSRRLLDIHDPAVVQEQLMIMARIKHEKDFGRSLAEAPSSVAYRSTDKEQGIDTRSESRNVRKEEGIPSRPQHKQEREQQQPQIDPTEMKRQMRKNDNFDEAGPTEIYPRQQLRIRGKRHTWKAIAEGNATLVNCAGCQRALQVDAAAELVYCSRCGAVFPRLLEIDVGGNRDSYPDSGTQPFPREILEERDAHIAEKMQGQEYDATLYKKTGEYLV